VELIEEKKELPPVKNTRQGMTDETVVPLRIEYGEKQLGRMARAAGGRWDAAVKLWFVPFGKVKGTELEKHMLLDAK
jgi:hypothetical protein